MERLDGNLDDLIETVPNIPLVLKQSILEDVSRGLLYLHKHTPQIIHRDLTAKNVLLNSYFMAKITDLGNSRIVNLQPGQLARTLSRLPGTLVYMPPEALSSSSRYGPSLDIFSFGHLALFTLTQVKERGNGYRSREGGWAYCYLIFLPWPVAINSIPSLSCACSLYTASYLIHLHHT